MALAPKRPPRARRGPLELRETAGAGYVLRRPKYARARKRKGGGFGAVFVVETELAYQLDQRVRVSFVALALARHYRDSLLAGLDGSGTPLPPVGRSTATQDARDGGRSAPWVGLRSGWMARHWLLLPTRGHQLEATKTIKPNGGSGGRQPERTKTYGGDRSWVINKLLDEGVDFQSVRGTALRVIEQADDAWLAGALGSPDELWQPATSQQTKGGTLDQFDWE